MIKSTTRVGISRGALPSQWSTALKTYQATPSKTRWMRMLIFGRVTACRAGFCPSICLWYAWSKANNYIYISAVIQVLSNSALLNDSKANSCEQLNLSEIEDSPAVDFVYSLYRLVDRFEKDPFGWLLSPEVWCMSHSGKCDVLKQSREVGGVGWPHTTPRLCMCEYENMHWNCSKTLNEYCHGKFQYSVTQQSTCIRL